MGRGTAADAPLAPPAWRLPVEPWPMGLVVAERASGRVVLGGRFLDHLWRGRDRPDGGWPLVDERGESRPASSWLIERALKGGTRQPPLLLRRDGSRGRLTVECSPLRDPSGHVIAAVGVLADADNDPLNALDHDLRTPLTALETLLHLAAARLAAGDPARAAGLLEAAREELPRLRGVAQEVRALARLQTGGL